MSIGDKQMNEFSKWYRRLSELLEEKGLTETRIENGFISFFFLGRCVFTTSINENGEYDESKIRTEKESFLYTLSIVYDFYYIDSTPEEAIRQIEKKIKLIK